MLKPLLDRVVIEPTPVETKTASGIIIPDTAKEKPLKGKVVAIGPGKKDETMTVKIGDEVLYDQKFTEDLKIDDKDLLIIHEEYIYGVL